MLQFPHGFLWGTATSAYQIEGAVHEGGRGLSIWDTFVHTLGKILHGDTGDVACDHYHRWKDDIALMKSLGYNAYRFSLAWPRLFPEGTGPINPAGLDYYNRLIDALLEAGITPMATLYHWDLPSALPGAWLNRDTAQAFADYAAAAARAYGDRVKLWMTLNEPWCSSLLSYYLGEHAPGERDLSTALKAAHLLLVGHGLAVPALRAAAPDLEVGIGLNLVSVQPVSDSPADRNSARQYDGYFNRWFLDPVFGRGYPEDICQEYAAIGGLPADDPDYVCDGDFDLISAPLDYLGINYYEQIRVRAESGHEFEPQRWQVVKDPLLPKTSMGWEAHPEGLVDLLMRVNADYHPRKIYITENGAGYSDIPDAQGRIHDVQRTEFLRDHIRAAGQAIQAGAPVAGYFAWSFLDNFEWSHGYSQRFGLVYVDFPTQTRLPKDSAFAYGQIASQNAIP